MKNLNKLFITALSTLFVSSLAAQCPVGGCGGNYNAPRGGYYDGSQRGNYYDGSQRGGYNDNNYQGNYNDGRYPTSSRGYDSYNQQYNQYDTNDYGQTRPMRGNYVEGQTRNYDNQGRYQDQYRNDSYRSGDYQSMTGATGTYQSPTGTYPARNYSNPNSNTGGFFQRDRNTATGATGGFFSNDRNVNAATGTNYYNR